MLRIAPSLLAADFGNLAEQVGEVASDADLLHLDVMDGHFVPNLTIGPAVAKSLRKHTGLFFDCHLMVVDPIKFVAPFKDGGADSVTFHIEVGKTNETIDEIKRHELGVGLALNPDTPFNEVKDYLEKIDMLLIMTVFPGYGGQSFMPEVIAKIKEAKVFIKTHELDVSIEVDGGIDHSTAPKCREAGADTFVAGTAIFRNERPWEAIRRLRNAIENVQCSQKF